MNETIVTKDAAAKTLTIERLFNASRQRVWDAWADADKLAEWWGPRGWKTTIQKFEFRDGGVWHYCMKCTDENQGEFFGQESWGLATFQEIVDQEKLSYVDEFADAEGNANPDMPSLTVTLEFKEDDGKTRLVSTAVFDSIEGYEKVIAMGVVEGMTETWDRLEELVTA